MNWLRPWYDGCSWTLLNKYQLLEDGSVPSTKFNSGRNQFSSEMSTPSKFTTNSIKISIHNESVKDLPCKAYKHSVGQEITCPYGTCFPWYDTGHTENDASNNSSIVASAFVPAVKFLQSPSLATIGGFLPIRCLATIVGYTDAQQRDLISLLSLFRKNRVGSWDHAAVCGCTPIVARQRLAKNPLVVAR
jgi:hypothetical protein